MILISKYVKDQEKFKKEEQGDDELAINIKIQFKATTTDYNINNITIKRKEGIWESNYFTLQLFNLPIVIF